MNVLKKGDCIELIKELPDNSIDLVVTSPPYDELRKSKRQTFRYDYDGYDP